MNLATQHGDAAMDEEDAAARTEIQSQVRVHVLVAKSFQRRTAAETELPGHGVGVAVLIATVFEAGRWTCAEGSRVTPARQPPRHLGPATGRRRSQLHGRIVNEPIRPSGRPTSAITPKIGRRLGDGCGAGATTTGRFSCVASAVWAAAGRGSPTSKAAVASAVEMVCCMDSFREAVRRLSGSTALPYARLVPRTRRPPAQGKSLEFRQEAGVRRPAQPKPFVLEVQTPIRPFVLEVQRRRRGSAMPALRRRGVRRLRSRSRGRKIVRDFRCRSPQPVSSAMAAAMCTRRPLSLPARAPRRRASAPLHVRAHYAAAT